MTVRLQLTGQTFGALTVLGEAGRSKFGKSQWACSCECGNQTVAVGSHLMSGNTTSCGCQRFTFGSSHGGSYTAEYRVWNLMRQRCHNPNSTAYKSYGARGIEVCDRWRASFAAFIGDMGPRPSPRHQIDRIDNDRGYEPGNCRWVTRRENMRNQRKTIWATIDGEKRSLPEWCERLGLNYGVIKARVVQGWTPERAVTEPIRRLK